MKDNNREDLKVGPQGPGRRRAKSDGPADERGADISLLAYALESIAEGVTITDMERNIIFVNKAREAMSGYSEDELLGKHVSILHGSRERADDIARITTEQGGWRGEISYRRKSGEEYETHLITSLVKNEEGEPVAIVSISRDLGEYKKMLREIAEAKDTLETIFEGITDGISLVDKNFRIMRVNSGFLNLIQKERGYLKGKLCYKEYCKREEPCDDCPVIVTLRTGGQAHTAREMVRDDGSRFDVDIYSFPIKDETGKVVQVVEYVKDVTERNRISREIEQSRRLTALGEMIASVAHDLHAPVQNIKLGIDLLASDLLAYDVSKTGGADSASKGAGYNALEDIRECVDSLTVMIRDLLDFSRLAEIDRSPWNIHDIINNSLKSHDAQLKEKGLNVEICYKDDLPLVSVDGVRIGEVFANLIENAIDAMEKGGELCVATDTATEEDRGYVRALFKDNGVGIPPENLGKVFTPFFTTKKRGIGLGMAIARRIIDLHGGKISIESQKGRGTVVEVLLPAEPA